MKVFSILLHITFGLLAITVAEAQHNLSLGDAVRLVTQNNQELQATALQNEIAIQQRADARGLFLPTVSLSGQVNHYFKRSPFFGFGSDASEEKIPYGRFGGEDQLGISLTAIQPIFNPVAAPLVKQSEYSLRQSQMQTRLAQINLVADVKQTYLQILVLMERKRLQEESIRRNQVVLRDARSLFLQGKAIRVDTLRAYTAIKNLEPQISKLQYGIESAKLQLRTLIGITDNDINLTDSLSVLAENEIPDETAVYEMAIQNNPLLQMTRLRIESEKQNVAVTSAARLPVVSAIGQYQLQSQTNDLAFADAHYPAASFVGLQLAVPLFTGLRVNAKTHAARLGHQQAQLREQYAREQLKTEVHQVLALHHESRERLETALSVRETALLSYDIISYRYQKGVSSRLELTDAEFELSSAKSNYLEAAYDYLSSQILLSKLTGSIE
ncbi:MAG TPA: TolC family protein [Ohtaekwangia sp.]|nr:TolC family protein [Ohtaekwangia sp.]